MSCNNSLWWFDNELTPLMCCVQLIAIPSHLGKKRTTEAAAQFAKSWPQSTSVNDRKVVRILKSPGLGDCHVSDFSIGIVSHQIPSVWWLSLDAFDHAIRFAENTHKRKQNLFDFQMLKFCHPDYFYWACCNNRINVFQSISAFPVDLSSCDPAKVVKFSPHRPTNLMRDTL